MNDAILRITPASQGPVALPSPRVPVSTRPATAADLPFIDSLQKQHTNAVGWMPTKQLEGKIAAGHVLVAEERHEGTEARRHEGEEGQPSVPSVPACLRASVPVPLGYCIARDQYFKRDDVGIVYQLNVAPQRQRGLIGAALLKAVFDRAAYGCRLFCCWCAQDIEANYFWQAMGFVPLAFRAGSREKGRVHIFWQRRIHAGDTTTPYWFPSQTTSGSIREDRLVFPIPAGVHWQDEMPRVLPGEQTPKLEAPKRTRNAKPTVQHVKPSAPTLGRLSFAPPVAPKAAKPKREPKPKAKNDPRIVAAARELRDRWLEQVNADASALAGEAKYDVSRRIEGREAEREVRLLPAAPRAMAPT